MALGSIFFGYSVFFFLLALFVFLMAFTKLDAFESQKPFCLFAFSILVLQAVDVVRLAFESEILHLPIVIKAAIYLISATIPAISAYFLCFWLSRLFHLNEERRSKGLEVVAALPWVVYSVLCVVSLKTHWLFYIDDQANYYRGPLFIIQLVIPYFYIAGIVVVLLCKKTRNSNFQNSKALKLVAMNAFPSVAGSIIQTYFIPQGNFLAIGMCVGLLTCYIAIYLDEIGERRRLKDLAKLNEKLKQVNQKLRATVDRSALQAKTVAESIRGGLKIGANDGVFSFSYISEQLARMLGYTVEELMEVSGGNMMGLVNHEDFARELEKIKTQLANGKIYDINYRIRCKDGSWKHVEDRGRLIRTEGAEDEFWSVIIDKDEIVKIENAIENMEKSRDELAHYNDIISRAGLGVWFVRVKEGELNRIWGNDKFYELTGIPKDMDPVEAHTMYFAGILKEDLPMFSKGIERMLQGEFAEVLYRWHHPTKGIIYNRCGGTATKLADGSFRLSGYHGDATAIVTNEQKQQELLKGALAVAEESSRAKTVFLNNMSHDIRTPMNAILGFARLMENECDNPQKIREHLKKLKGAGDFLLSLINNVLEMAHIESGKIEINEIPVCLGSDIECTFNIFEAELNAKNLTLETHFEIEHYYVYIDLLKIREIIINLLSNAIKYSKVGGHITSTMREVPCSKEGFAKYEFVIEDDGLGMSEEFLPHVFDAFVREHNSTESKVAGTGLGMPIVKKLIDILGGTISVESKLNVGSKFTVTLTHKICSEGDVAREANENSGMHASIIGKRILLAEDNELNAEIAITLLQEAGLFVERAENGAECLKMLTGQSADYYDFVLMDVQMPVMGGYEAARKIRALDDERKNIPIIAMTANAFEEDRRHALEAGMNNHIAKPVDMNLLLKALSNLA